MNCQCRLPATSVIDGRRIRASPAGRRNKGFALIAVVSLIGMLGLFLLIDELTAAQLRNQRVTMTATVLQQARDAVIAQASSPATAVAAGALANPDLGPGINTEGSASTAFAGNNQDLTLVGKLPWKKLGIAPQRGGDVECLWYVVSGRFKTTPKTATLNWDTTGQVDVIDSGGNLIAGNLAALVIAPGSPRDGQNRALGDPNYAQCGGNYDAKNYLDPYNLSDAISGELNYFSSTNGRLAPDTSNKRFVLAENDHYDDRIVFISVDDIFRPIIRRTDFAVQIGSLLDDLDFRAHLDSIAVSGAKGSDNIDCSSIVNADNKTFCQNWKEMLLLTRLAPPSTITIDGSPSAVCQRVLIFAGQRTTGQVRLTTADKLDPANYLEEPNRSAFATPIAAGNAFAGATTFSSSAPSAEIMRCLT